MAKANTKVEQQRRELQRMAQQIQSPQQLALVLAKVPDETHRNAIYNLVLPMLKPVVREAILNN